MKNRAYTFIAHFSRYCIVCCLCVCLSGCEYAMKSKLCCGFTLGSSHVPWSPLQVCRVSLKKSMQVTLLQGVSFWLHCFLILIPSALWKCPCKTAYSCSRCCLRNSSRASLIGEVEQQNRYHLVSLAARGVPAEAADAGIPKQMEANCILRNLNISDISDIS